MLRFVAIMTGILLCLPLLSLQAQEKSEQDRYPTIEYPPGYYKGAFFFSFIGGRSIAPSGSFIRHEKEYDELLALQIRNGDYINPIRTITANSNLPSSFDAEYTPGYSWQIELEYGTFSHFGFGFTVSQFSIEAKRQDVFLSGANPPLVTPVPISTTLYNGTAAMGMAAFHPIEKSVFDPYVVVRAGMVGFNGQAHSSSLPDPNRLSNRIQNGLGMATGAGLGVNIHFTRVVGIKAEAFYHKQFLKSDNFPTRTLDTYTAQIGVVVNTTRLFPN